MIIDHRYFIISFLTLLVGCSHAHATRPAMTIFAHGILDSGEQVTSYTQQKAGRHAIIFRPYATFNFADACTVYGLKLCKFWNCSFGQENDIQTLDNAYRQLVERFPLHDMILVGMSRGSSVIISYVATYHPKEVKALVLESPFDRVQSALDAAVDQIPLIISCVVTRALASSILRTIACNYNPCALQPVDLIDKISLDLPVLLIASEEDKLVRIQSTYALYKKLCNAGHQHVYLLRLTKGRHSKLLHAENGQQYAQVVHAFYQKYNLPHDPILAEQGQELLMKSHCLQ